MISKNEKLNIFPTPVQYSPFLSELMNTNFYFKRDDLYISGGGGSKARMLDYILSKAKSENAEYILTAGGPYSNFNRALALKANKYGLKVKLVLYDKNTHLNDKNLNKRICDYCDIEYIPCEPDNVVETIENEKNKLNYFEIKYYYIWGGGKSNEGVQAYFDCVNEIKSHIDFSPNYFVVPLGTGTTFSGLSLGCEQFMPDTKTIGISIARKRNEIVKVIDDIILDFLKANSYDLHTKSEYLKDYIHDEFILGGYGKVNKEYLSFIKEITKNESTVFDDIYVGKALYGLYKLNKENKMLQNKNTVFINTGGIYNF